MKLSIKAIFKNITILLALLTILLAVLSFTEFQRYHSYEKFDDLFKIQKTVSKLSSLTRSNPSYSEILLKSYTNTILNQIQELREFSNNGFLLGLTKQQETKSAIDKLQASIALYEQNLKSYLFASKQQERYALKKVIDMRTDIILQIKKIEEIFVQTNFVITDKLQWLVYFTFLLALFTLLFYGKRLRTIHLDIETLYGISSNDALKMKTLTQEVEAIKQRMVRKPSVSDNSSMIDPVTQIKNYKGMIYSYANKKGIKEKEFTAVCLFEVDNLDQNSNLSQEFIKNVLKKIASIFSLYEHATDVVARYSFNQFVFVISRDTKAQMFQECESIRHSIEELKFKQTQENVSSFTVSGGFVIKPRNKSLDDILKDASKLLLFAKKRGGNKIIQIKDYAENF